MSKKRQKHQSRPTSRSRTPEVEALLRAAFDLRQQGRLEEAAARCSAILEERPTDADALNLLGTLLLGLGRAAEAQELFQSAVEQRPRDAEFHNNLGSAYRSVGDVQTAVASFQRATKLRSNFALAFSNLGSALGVLGQFEPALTALKRAAALDPAAADTHSDLGVCHQALGRMDAAIDAFERAITLNPSHERAHENLAVALEVEDRGRVARRSRIVTHYLKAMHTQPGAKPRRLSHLTRTLVPGWHFRMLNDKTRNEAFDRAVREVVDENSVVLDIGTGSGLLAMMAARAGARHVYACEFVEPLAVQARENIRRNGYQDRVTVIAKGSTELVVGTDMPAHANVLLTETADAGLLGEATIPSIRHARENLLTKHARFIPCGASVYAMLVESTALRERDEVGSVLGFDVSGFNAFSTSPKYLQVAVSSIPYRQLCEPFHVFNFDFAASTEVERSREVAVSMTQTGRVDAVVFWFSLHLAEGVSISTDPRATESHWDQAVVLTQPPKEAQQAQTLLVKASHDDMQIRFEF